MEAIAAVTRKEVVEPCLDAVAALDSLDQSLVVDPAHIPNHISVVIPLVLIP